MQKDSCEGYLAALALKSIAPGTRRMYEARFAALRKFCKNRGFEKITKEAFGCFLWHHASVGCAKSTFQGYRSALLFYQECQSFDLEAGERPWAGDRLILRAVDGAAVEAEQHRQEKCPRGYVSENMLHELVRWVTPRANGPQLARAFRVQYYAALRSCEVEKIRGGDLRVEGSWSHLLIRHDKTKSYSTDKQRCKPLTHVATEEVRNALRDVTHGDLAFPAYKKRSTSKLVKRASTELGWPSGVTFDGTHTLRHGGTGAIVENVADMMSSALSGMSRQVRQKHYLAPHSQVHD